jgi:hypothetical protein
MVRHPGLAHAMLDNGHVDRIFRIACSAASNEPLVTTSVRVGLHDGYFESAIRLDFVHGTLQYALGCDVGATTGDDFHSDCSANIPLAFPRIEC